LALPLDHPYRGETLRHISRLQINLKLRHNKTKDLREVIMNLSPAYDKWLEETLTQGRKEGLKEGLKESREETGMTIAARMLQINLPIETIVQVTGLSVEMVQSLRSNETDAAPLIQ
jgi:predicted transposase/invertase (TIGR01784 family)